MISNGSVLVINSFIHCGQSRDNAGVIQGNRKEGQSNEQPEKLDDLRSKAQVHNHSSRSNTEAGKISSGAIGDSEEEHFKYKGLVADYYNMLTKDQG